MRATKDALDLRAGSLEKLSTREVWQWEELNADLDESTLFRSDRSHGFGLVASAGARLLVQPAPPQRLVAGNQEPPARTRGALALAKKMGMCAELCAREKALRPSCALLRTALEYQPLGPEASGRVRSALHAATVAAGLGASAMDGEVWRLEAAYGLLLDGADQPWPETIAFLVNLQEADADDASVVTTQAVMADALARLTKEVLPTSVTEAWTSGAPVLVCDPDQLEWSKARIERVLPDGGGYDVMVGGWHARRGVPSEFCIAICEEGAGSILLAGAEQNNAALVSALFDIGVSPFSATADADTALHIAARLGHTDCVRAVHQHPSLSVDEKWNTTQMVVNVSGESPLYLAIQNNHLAIRSEFDPTLSDKDRADEEHDAGDGTTLFARLLRKASKAGDISTVRDLLQSGLNVDAASEATGVTALQLACGGGRWETHGETICALLEAAADPNAVSHRGCTALIIASSRQRTETVEELLRRGVSVNHSQADGDTALIHASRYGRVQIAQSLIDARAEINAKGANAFTPAIWAAAIGSYETLRILLEAKADANQTNARGETPLYVACRNGQNSCVGFLLSLHDPSSDERISLTTRRSEDGFSPIHTAAKYGHTVPVEYLLQVPGAAEQLLEARTHNGQTALMVAANFGQPDVTEVLLQQGADANATREDGSTALILCCMHETTDDEEVLRILMVRYRGAEVNKSNSVGDTALHVAAKIGHEVATSSLLEQQADPTLVNNEGLTPLHIASSEGHEGTVSELVDSENISYEYINIRVTDGKPMAGLTPLLLAVRYGHREVVQVLLDVQADLTCRTMDGEDALTIARANGHTAVVELLDVGRLSGRVTPMAQSLSRAPSQARGLQLSRGPSLVRGLHLGMEMPLHPRRNITEPNGALRNHRPNPAISRGSTLGSQQFPDAALLAAVTAAFSSSSNGLSNAGEPPPPMRQTSRAKQTLRAAYDKMRLLRLLQRLVGNDAALGSALVGGVQQVVDAD